MTRKFVSLLLIVLATSTAQVQIAAADLPLRSNGNAEDKAWTLTGNGYVGTYFTLSDAGTATIAINASGTASNGLSPRMTVVVADWRHSFDVNAAGDFTQITPQLPAGTYFVRIQLDNQNGKQNPTLSIKSVNITGAGVAISNNNTDDVALAAARTYSKNFRSGLATVTLSSVPAGSDVHVKLISNAFNFCVAVYGNNTGDATWLNLDDKGAYVAPKEGTDQFKYQQIVRQNFNMIVPSNGGKWVNNEGSTTQPSVPSMGLVDAETQFAVATGLRMRMHNIIWNNQQPPWLLSLFPAASPNQPPATEENKAKITAAVENRINYYLTGVNPLVGKPRAQLYLDVDLFNEHVHGLPKQANYLGTYGAEGIAKFYSDAAKAVKDAGAAARLYLNEYNVLQSSSVPPGAPGPRGADPYANWYFRSIQEIQNAGGAVGGIGLQLYTSATPISPATMQQSYQNMSVAYDPDGKPMPLMLSEFGANQGRNGPTPEVFAKDLTDALDMTYGTPQAVTWGYWGGAGGPYYAARVRNSPAPLYDGEYNLNASGKAYQQWMSQWNIDLTIKTDDKGAISFRGTYGTYELTVNGKTTRFEHKPGQDGVSLIP